MLFANELVSLVVFEKLSEISCVTVAFSPLKLAWVETLWLIVSLGLRFCWWRLNWVSFFVELWLFLLKLRWFLKALKFIDSEHNVVFVILQAADTNDFPEVFFDLEKLIHRSSCQLFVFIR